jgi:hypothetical protein
VGQPNLHPNNSSLPLIHTYLIAHSVPPYPMGMGSPIGLANALHDCISSLAHALFSVSHLLFFSLEHFSSSWTPLLQPWPPPLHAPPPPWLGSPCSSPSTSSLVRSAMSRPASPCAGLSASPLAATASGECCVPLSPLDVSHM